MKISSLLTASLPTTLASVAVALLSPIDSAKAQSLPPLPIQLEGRTWTNPGQPGNRRRGGGSRGSCHSGIPLTVLAYADSMTVEELEVTRTDEAVGVLTSLPTPTLWFYLPMGLNETTAEFVLKDSLDRVVYQGELTGEMAEAGVIEVPLTVSLPSGRAVRWFLTLDCDESDRTTVDGWIESRDPGTDLARTFSQATPRNRVALYTNYGYLHDALSELAGLRQINPDDEILARAWGEFLTTLDLGDIANEPILDCCQLSSAEDSEPEPDSEPAPELENEPQEGSDESQPEPSAEPEEVPEEEEDTRSILQRARDRGN